MIWSLIVGAIIGAIAGAITNRGESMGWISKISWFSNWSVALRTLGSKLGWHGTYPFYYWCSYSCFGGFIPVRY